MNIRLILCSAAMAAGLGASAGEAVRLKALSPADFSTYGTSASSISYEQLPSRWLIADWHKLGVKIYHAISPNPGESPELFRRRAGFVLFRSMADGLDADACAKLPKAYANALAAAKDDYKLAAQLGALADRALKSDDADLRREGRLARGYLYVTADLAGAPSALIRREIVRLARGLQQRFGEKPMAVPADIPDDPPPAVDDPKGLERYTPGKSKGDVLPGVSLTFGGEVCAFTLHGDEEVGKDGWPEKEVTLTLSIQDEAHTAWATYRLCFDLTSRKPADGKKVERAPTMPFITLVPRFASATPPRFRVEPTRLYSRTYPRLGDFSWNAYTRKKDGKGWSVTYTIPWQRLIGFFPVGANAHWLLGDGARTVRIDWRRGGLASYYGGIKWEDAVKDFQGARGAASDWSYADPLFYKAFVVARLEKDATLVEALGKNKGKDVIAGPKSVQERAFENMPSAAFLGYDVRDLRVKYLDDLLNGREIKVPPPKKKVDPYARATSSQLRPDDEDTINLDDSEY